jgi:sugar transferase (PEP-CTERM/EpsH1 system associated)
MDDLLFLSHRIPYPPDKGDKIRAWYFLRHLAERYRVHLACFVDDPGDVKFVPKLQEICASVCWRPLVPLRAKLRSLPGILSDTPLTRGYFRDRRLKKAIDRIIVQHRPERFFVFSSAMAPYVERHRAARRVIDMVDVDSEKWRHYAERTSGLSRIIYAREARTLLTLERRAAVSADSILFVSRPEADLFRRLVPEAAPRTHHIDNGVDTVYFDPAHRFANPFAGTPAIAFVGAMNYRPNIDAVVWFVREVMPGLRHLADRPSFWVVGSNPSAAVQRLAGGDVYVTGRVEDVRPYLAHAAAVVAPLRIARGIQNKVLEAMAMAAPVIVTRHAREGLEACGRDELIEANTAEAFADAIRHLLVEGGAAIGARARERVRRDFSWQSSFDALDTQLEPASREPRETAQLRPAANLGAMPVAVP